MDYLMFFLKGFLFHSAEFAFAELVQLVFPTASKCNTSSQWAPDKKGAGTMDGLY